MGDIEIGTILDSKIEKNQDAENATQLFQIELAEEGDTQTIEELHIPGIQYKPAANSRGFVSRVTSAWKILLGIDDFIPKETLAEGERLFYSDDGSVIKTKLHFKNDGSAILTVPAGLSVIGDLSVTGAVNATGIIKSDIDVEGPNIKLESHTHIANLGADTAAPTTGALTPLGSPIVVPDNLDMDGNNITNAGEVTANGKNLSTHVHSGSTSGPDNTGGPV